MTVAKITNAPTQKELIDKTNEVIDNMIVNQSSDNSSFVISNETLTPTRTAQESISIGCSQYAGVENRGSYNIAIGRNAYVESPSSSYISTHSVAIGANADVVGSYSIGIGEATTGADGAIQIGYGTNNTANSLKIGFYNNSSTHYNWQLLDGTTGLIPTARLSTFTGADGTNAGTAGIVPAPTATDNDKYLKGDGTWATVSGGSATDVQINGTSITSGGTANIITNSAYNASSNKIATMSDLPSTSGLANTDLSNLSNTGNAKFQAPLVSGTNIKTINSTTLLGSGDIDTKEIFVATYDVTSFADIAAAVNDNNKFVVCYYTSAFRNLVLRGYNSANNAYDFTQIGEDNKIYKASCALSGSTTVWSHSTFGALQAASTAVTHTASTQVGDSDTPVYIASDGTATSTGKSIANTRFDGQWVHSYKTLSTATAIGDKTLDLNSYLPVTNGIYEVLLWVTYYNSNSTTGGLKIWSDIITTHTNAWINANSNSRSQVCYITMPVTRYLYTNIYGHSANDSYVDALAYRRVGTNT